VVNKFDLIRRPERCRRDVLDQIKQISPQTFEDADNLVHFVSSRQCLLEEPDNPSIFADFVRLEDCLRSFVLEKRSKSKLAPAKMYLKNLLSDLIIVAQYNRDLAAQQVQQLEQDLTKNTPTYEMMTQIKREYLDDLDKVIDVVAGDNQKYTAQLLKAFLTNLDLYADDIDWLGIFYVWQYSKDLRNILYKLASLRLNRCEEYSKKAAKDHLQKILDMASTCASDPIHIDLSVAETMFEAENKPFILNPPDLDDMFDTADKIEVIKEFVPATGLLGLGLLGHYAVTSGILSKASRLGYLLGKSRSLFVGVSVIGIGYFCYVLSDMRRVVRRKVLGKIRAHIVESEFIDSAVDRIGKATRRILRMCFWEFQTQFQQQLNAIMGHRNQQLKTKENAEEEQHYFEMVSSRCHVLSNAVNRVELEDLRH
jgi:mitofusin